MKGVVFTAVGAEPKVADDLPMPEPGEGQVLVKSLWTAINPVDAFSATTGLLVVGWPFTVGADASGVITKTGANVPSHLSVGTHVFGCTRLGSPGYGTGAEYLLMDAQVTFALTPKMQARGIDGPAAATLGAGVETAALGVFDGLHVPLSALAHPAPKDEWIVILGGASSVGKSAVQLARAAGYQVLASCSPASAPVVERFGAKWFSYREPLDAQVDAVMATTEGKVSRIFDAVAANDPEVAKKVFEKVGGEQQLFFTTTNDWSGIPDFAGGKTKCIELGPVGRPEATQLNETIAEYIAACTPLLEDGRLVPSEYQVIGEGGFDAVIEAYKYQLTGKAGNKKVVVKVQDA